jgi:hypothetical protein
MADIGAEAEGTAEVIGMHEDLETDDNEPGMSLILR